MQLTGKDLLPFNADKQTAFGLSVFYAFNDDTSLYTLNVTDFAAPPAVVRHRSVSRHTLQLRIIFAMCASYFMCNAPCVTANLILQSQGSCCFADAES